MHHGVSFRLGACLALGVASTATLALPSRAWVRRVQRAATFIFIAAKPRPRHRACVLEGVLARPGGVLRESGGSLWPDDFLLLGWIFIRMFN